MIQTKRRMNQVLRACRAWRGPCFGSISVSSLRATRKNTRWRVSPSTVLGLQAWISTAMTCSVPRREQIGAEDVAHLAE
ncbi:MAG: hypothetical protein M3315_08320 [Actinomycetota bacterium]|nr:hypothetical protein [Actinomycetota bacterium]